MKRKAFTLVELLMVVVIIGILVTIMYPRFKTFRIRARLKEVPNTVQLILAGEKYYYGKVGGYFPWDAAVAEAGYVDAGPPVVRVEHELNITFPREAKGCEYWMDDATGEIYFRRADTHDPVGSYDLSTDEYTIDADYDKYLGYLE